MKMYPSQIPGCAGLEEFHQRFPFQTHMSCYLSQKLRNHEKIRTMKMFTSERVNFGNKSSQKYRREFFRPVSIQSSDDDQAEADLANRKKVSLTKDIIRQIISERRSLDAKNVLLDNIPSISTLEEEQCLEILTSCVSSGNHELLSSILSSMLARNDSSAWGSSDTDSVGSSQFEWPRVTVRMSTEIVKALCRNLDTKFAQEVLSILRYRGVQSSEEIHFGYVVDCADGSGRPLALMQPHEGSKIVSDSFSKYEYEIFSGKVIKSDSESLVASLSWLKQVGSKLGKISTAAMHTLTVESPTGQQRTFKFGTYLASSPAKVGDKISVVCAPEQGKSLRQDIRYSGILSPSPPGKRPGEALSITNHTIGDSVLLNRPSQADNSLINGWLLIAFVVLASADAASSLFDPSLPLLIAGAVGSSTIVSSVGAKVVLPNLKKLPEASLGIQETRQRLLQEHVRLTANVKQLLQETSSDVRTLARLWQLLNKMGSIDNKNAYVSRIERVVNAKDATEERLSARISMMNEYTKVLSMIEIEVEMETEIPVAEYQGMSILSQFLHQNGLIFMLLPPFVDIQRELSRLSDIEELQAEWRAKVEAQDEVEKILRSYPSTN